MSEHAVFEKHQNRLDASVNRVISGEPELGEDGIDVFFHRPLSQDQPLGHRPIAASGGVHEKKILASDTAADPAVYAADFAVGQSDAHQISHTKGGVLDGIVAFEGSTNWSASGEGTGITLNQTRQKSGFKAQNNTLTVYVNAYEIAKFAARLDYEHAVAAAKPQPAVPAN